MTRKLVALLLVVSMVFCMFSGCASTQEIVTNTTVEVDGYDIIVRESKTKREATSTLEGVPITCEHLFETQEYWLYINEEPIELGVTFLEDGLEVCLASEIDTNNLEESVVAQSALVASIAAPSFMELAKYIIAISILGYASDNIAVSADAIGDVISGIRYNTRTYYRYRTVDVSAADAIRLGRMNKYNAYYEAYLKGNTVFISRQISEYEAVRRLERGYDVFATSAFAAGWAAMKASTIKSRFYASSPHASHVEGGYPHYHAYGRRWVNNSNSAPHAWYPY